MYLRGTADALIRRANDMSYDLQRFKEAQERDYETALQEVRAGRKRSHWIWYIFPQLKGLGQSSTSYYYGIDGIGEARAYLADPSLSSRLREISKALLALEQQNPNNIFGNIDAQKVCSCMTLFEIADGTEHSVFSEVLDKFYGGYRDQFTAKMCEGK